jgi:phosphate transport system substrate-binding protein
MFSNNQFKWASLAAAGLVAATATVVVPNLVQAQGGVIKVDGSSTVFPVTEAAASGFQKSGGAKVTVGVSGTGGGFKKFCAGETDISNASRPILKKEMEACKAKGIQYIELPVAYDALTVVVHPRNPINSIKTEELKKIWAPEAQGKVMKWNQVFSGWPNANLRLFGPGADSGTFDYFTEAINGKSKSIRKDFTASENDNVLVQGVSSDVNAMGYFGFAYYQANRGKLKALAVNGVLPSEQNVMNGKYSPLSRPIFIYVNAKSAQRPEVKRFVQYYLNNGAAISKQARYFPLPASAYKTILGHFNKNRVGTVFGGDEAVGLTVEELISRETR